jgi:hypothetical protein
MRARLLLDLMGSGGVMALVVMAGVAMAGVACSGSSSSSGGATGESSCPNDLPACPASSPPSYQTDVQPVIKERCTACHFAGSTIAKLDFTSYPSVYQNRGPILDQLYACNMPPSTAPAPTPAERATLLTWLVCGATNN